MLTKKHILFFCIVLLLFIWGIARYMQFSHTVACTNAKGFTTPSDLSHAFQLILQKTRATPQLGALLIHIPQFTNCLHIDRADLDEQDTGFAIFYPDSTLNDLHIFIDFLYQSNDTVLTGYVLVGKLARANDFIIAKSKGLQISCQEQNIHEGQAQLAYLASLTPEEIKELNYYIAKEFYTYKDFITKKILSQQLHVIQRCLSQSACGDTVISYPKTNNLAIDTENQCF